MTAEQAVCVLLIEDTKTDAIVIRNSLTKASAGQYTIQHVQTIKEAMDTVASNNFDVILLDLSLPDAIEFDGLTRLHALAPQIPVIILTSHQDEETAVQSVAFGAQDYLYKDGTNAESIRRAIRYAMQRKQMEGNLFTRANFDHLTELSNRTFFENRLDMAIERGKRGSVGIAVFFLDLNRFKQVNDTLGHAAGDVLLKQVAGRIRKSVRPYDTVARFGGDEFALLVEDSKQAQDCVAVAEKIIEQLAIPFEIQGKQVEIGVSIGIAFHAGNAPIIRERIIEEADKAMYAAKMTRKNTYRFYEDVSAAGKAAR